MGVRPALIYADNPGAIPATYSLPPGFDVQVNSVSATFNGAAAVSAFKACLAIYSQDDKLVGRFFPGTLFAVGDSGEVTFAPFLRAAIEGLAAASANGATVMGTGGYGTFSPLATAFDPSGYFAAANNSRLTVPPDLGGIYLVLGRYQQGRSGGGYVGVRVRKNGALIEATAEQVASPVYNIMNVMTWALDELTEGDFYEVQGIHTAGANRTPTGSLCLVLVDDADTCYATFSGATSLGSGAFATVDLVGQIDTSGMHSDSVSPSRITAVAAGNYLVFAAGAWAPNGVGKRGVRVTKNGAEVVGTLAYVLASAGVTAGAVNAAAVVALAAGDYLEAEHYQDSGGALNLVESRLCAIRQVSDSCGYANGVGTVALPGAIWTTVSLASEDVDPEGWHSDAANPELFTAQTSGYYLLLPKSYAQSPQRVVGARVLKNGGQLDTQAQSTGDNAQPVTAVGWVAAPSLEIGDQLIVQAYEGDAGDTCERANSSFAWARLLELTGDE